MRETEGGRLRGEKKENRGAERRGEKRRREERGGEEGKPHILILLESEDHASSSIDAHILDGRQYFILT